MSEDQVQNTEQVAGDKPEDAPQQPQSVSVQDILNAYPIDRDKCRDVVLLEVSANLRRIADSLEGISQGLIVANTHLSEANKLKKGE